ncbi:MAG TPA: trehalose-phosphatase [Methylomirabilota bacterium]
MTARWSRSHRPRSSPCRTRTCSPFFVPWPAAHRGARGQWTDLREVGELARRPTDRPARRARSLVASARRPELDRPRPPGRGLASRGAWRSCRIFAARTPGSLVEEKTASLAWHYRATDPEYGASQANELRVHLTQILGKRTGPAARRRPRRRGAATGPRERTRPA